MAETLPSAWERSAWELSAWDELLVHQAAVPVAQAGSSDHRFFDRIVVLGHDPAGQLAVLLGFAVYKNLNVIEGFACVRHGYRQHNLRLSRSLRPAGPSFELGPLRVDVEVPLARLRVRLAPDERWPHAFDLVFDGAVPPVAEAPHLTSVDGRRSEDFLRYHQVGALSGRVELAGSSFEADTWFGLRDHSWGVRPGVGGPEPRTGARGSGWPAALFGWFAFLTPTAAGQFELRADGGGAIARLVGHVLDRTTGVRADVVAVKHTVRLVEGTGRFAELDLAVTDALDRNWSIAARPSGRAWVFRGAGYDRGYSDGRGLGCWRGDDLVEVDEYDVAHVDDVVLAPGAAPVRTRHREQPVDVVVNGTPGAGHTFWSLPV